MPTDFAFRLSTYIALALSCVCLGYAEWEWLPVATVLAGLVVLALVGHFLLEGRAELSLLRANILGGVIAVVAIVWLAFEITHPTSPALTRLDWPTSFLPYIGPLLMVLIPAKLFRPKHVGDWWTMHGIGMASVALASSMEDNSFYAVILVLYVLAEIVSLTLFYFRRSAGAVAPLPGIVTAKPHVALPSVVPVLRPRRLIFGSAFWLLIACAIALPLFFVTPRSSGARWEFGRNSRMTVGYSPEAGIDLTKTGIVETDDQLAFTVTAKQNGQPKEDLPQDQYWRGYTQQVYLEKEGSWKSAVIQVIERPTIVSSEGRTFPPNLGPDSYLLNYKPEPTFYGRPIASPLFWAHGEVAPAATLRTLDNGTQLVDVWQPHVDCGFGTRFLVPKQVEQVRVETRRAPSPYQQITRPEKERGLSEPFLRAATLEAQRGDMNWRVMRVAAIREWSLKLLNRLVAEGKLPQEVKTELDRQVEPRVVSRHYEIVARAFRDYFANSGEFTYSLRLKIENRKVDPIEDFLTNTKNGHCRRFASALTATLLSLQIPAQLVSGFKGCEYAGDGVYLVRQSHAHDWVEVLIPRPMPADFPEQYKGEHQVVWHWLTLDPTPGGDSGVTQSADWFTSVTEFGTAFIEDFIIGYNPQRREKTVEAASSFFEERWYYLLVLPVGFVAWRILRRYRKRRSMTAPTIAISATHLAWYDRYLRIMLRYGFPLVSGSTPREHAEQSKNTLLAISHPEIAELPMFIISKLYRVRYGGQTLQADEVAEIEKGLDQLEEALKQLPPVKAGHPVEQLA